MAVPFDLPPVPFNLRVVRHGTGVVVRLSGEFDLAARGVLEKKLRDLEWYVSELVIALREVTFIDSSGLHQLVHAWERSQRDGFQLAIVRGPGRVQRVF